MTKKSKSPGKFNPDHLRFHIVAALGATVLLTVLVVLSLRLFTRHNSEFPMPDYIGQDANRLTQEQCRERFVFVVNEYEYVDGIKPGTVLKQNPPVGQKVKKDRKVYLTVASNEPPTVKMPDLVNLSYRQARIILEAQGLQLGEVIEKPSEYENAVLQQLYGGRIIAKNTDIKKGEKITLVIGKRIDELEETGPDSADVGPAAN